MMLFRFAGIFDIGKFVLEKKKYKASLSREALFAIAYHSFFLFHLSSEIQSSNLTLLVI